MELFSIRIQRTFQLVSTLVENRLLHSQMRICEIVEELGFTDESHLNKFFKKYRGCSPSNFRKNNLK